MKFKTLLLILTFLLFSKPLLAQSENTGLNLVISPLPIILTTSPGSTVSAQLRVKNGGEAAENLEVGLMKFSAYGDEGQPRLMDREANDNYFDWVTFSEKQFTLDPGQWKTITANFTIPTEAAFGYYYAVTFSRQNNDIIGDQKSTKVVGATATLILLEARVPNAKREIEVVDFSTPRAIYEFLPVKFNVKLKNKGNVHVAPTGNIFIEKKGQEKAVAILNINDLAGNVLPDSNRVFESEWTEGFPVYEIKMVNGQVVADSTGKMEYQLKWDLSQIPKLRWGKYTASMLLVYDDGQRDIPVEAKLTFWVIPWRLIGGTLLVVLLVLRGFYSMIKKPLGGLTKKHKR